MKKIIYLISLLLICTLCTLTTKATDYSIAANNTDCTHKKIELNDRATINVDICKVTFLIITTNGYYRQEGYLYQYKDTIISKTRTSFKVVKHESFLTREKEPITNGKVHGWNMGWGD
jgi:hypothetical protein